MLYCPIVLGLPKLLPKESTIAELLPSASTFLNTFVICCFVFSFCQIKQLYIAERILMKGFLCLSHWYQCKARSHTFEITVFRWMREVYRWLWDYHRRLPECYRWLPKRYRWVPDRYRCLRNSCCPNVQNLRVVQGRLRCVLDKQRFVLEWHRFDVFQ